MSTWHSLGSASAPAGQWANCNVLAPPLCQQLRLYVTGPNYVYGQYAVNSNLHGPFEGAGYHYITPFPAYSEFPVDANCQDTSGEHSVEIQVYY